MEEIKKGCGRIINQLRVERVVRLFFDMRHLGNRKWLKGRKIIFVKRVVQRVDKMEKE